MIRPNLIKEVCGCCKKFINIGHSITECQNCNSVIHTKCYKKSNFNSIENLQYCQDCTLEIQPKYNPFSFQRTSYNKDGDHHYDEDITETLDILNTASHILNSCTAHTINDLSKTLGPNKSDFSTMFLNIDGNKSNFDGLAAELSTLNHEFSLIGLAETNVDPSLKNLYPITNYNSFYQDTINNKSKGTGVALYVHNSLNAVVNQELSQITPDIESLFLNIAHHDKNINIGVIYRPPSGNMSNFLDEFSKIITKIPKCNSIYIMGDFNINLLESQSSSTLQFEELFLSQGLFPLISTITHEKLHCKGSCIDNVFSNDIDKITLSGTISTKLTSHSPIFSVTKLHDLHDTKQKLPPQTLYYNYSDENIKKFAEELETKLEKLNDEPNFSNFIEIFNESLDKTCKRSKPKTTKRTTSNNPWITDSIIRAVNEKHEFYRKWKKNL